MNMPDFESLMIECAGKSEFEGNILDWRGKPFKKDVMKVMEKTINELRP